MDLGLVRIRFSRGDRLEIEPHVIKDADSVQGQGQGFQSIGLCHGGDHSPNRSAWVPARTKLMAWPSSW
jgi:hypothetical protein